MTSRPRSAGPAVLILAALAFLALFLLLPLVVVFVEALKHGLAAYAAALVDPDALEAFKGLSTFR